MSPIDIGLQEQVHTAISASPFVSRHNLRYETSDGRVTLRGTVGSYYQKQMAQEALRMLDGIKQIENRLEVSWS